MNAGSRIELAQRGDAQVISVHGECDLTNSGELRTVCSQAAAEAAALVVDLTPTEFIDSVVIGELIHASGHVGEGRFAVAVRRDSQPARVLGLALVERLFPVVDGLDAACRAANSRDVG